MKQKLFTLLTLLLCAVSTMWAETITVTWLPNDMTAKTTSGTASVDGILTISDFSVTSTITHGDNLTYDSKKWGNFTSTTRPDKNTIATSDYITFTVTVKEGYVFTPTSATAYWVGIGTGNNAAGLYSSTQESNVKSAADNSSNASSTNQNSLELSGSYSSGENVTFYIHIGQNNTTTNKGVAIRDVVLTGEYDVEGVTKLSSPSITVNQSTGQITIGNVENATKITYTTDGTDPTDASTEYSAPFTVKENCTIKAIAIGDGKSYSNSIISNKVANITVENPVITAHNGTVGITCATDGATIKYNFDNGEKWETYSQPFTLFEGKTVYAKAERADYKNNSSTVSSVVAAAPAAAPGSQSKILQWIEPANTNNWEYMEGDNGSGGTNHYGIKGKADTEEDGWSLWISPNSNGHYDKALSNATYSSTINETTYSFLKNSNGRQFNIGIPSNIRANRITIYSYNAAADQKTIWSNVGGTTYTTDTEVSIVSSSYDTPETRVFALDDIADNIILNNAGYQQCFMVVVDYTKYVVEPASAEDNSVVLTYSNGSVDGQTKVWSGTGDYVGYSITPSEGGSIGVKSTTKYALAKDYTYTIDVPADMKVTSFKISGSSNASSAVTVTYNEIAETYAKNNDDPLDHSWDVANPAAGQSITFSVAGQQLNVASITLYTGTITLTTTVNMDGWRAFYDDSKSYTVDENTKIYTVTAKDETKATLTEVTGRIPAQTPVLLKTSDANRTMTLTAATTGDAINTNGNLLQATNGSAVSNVYRLGCGAEGVGFYQYSATNPANGIVYLPNAGGAKALTFSFGDVTGISNAAAAEAANAGTGKMYNLSGQIVGEGYKGIVIVNGKKVIK